MKPETMEKVVAVAGTVSGCTALLGCAAFVLGSQLALLGAAAGIVLTAVCAGCLAGMQIGRMMAPVATEQLVTEVAAPTVQRTSALRAPAERVSEPRVATERVSEPRVAAERVSAQPVRPPRVAPRVVPVRPMRFAPLPQPSAPIETPSCAMPAVSLPAPSGTFEMSKAHIDALNGLCDSAKVHQAGLATVELDPTDLLQGDLEDSFATVPMRFVEDESGGRVQLLRW